MNERIKQTSYKKAFKNEKKELYAAVCNRIKDILSPSNFILQTPEKNTHVGETDRKQDTTTRPRKTESLFFEHVCIYSPYTILYH